MRKITVLGLTLCLVATGLTGWTDPAAAMALTTVDASVATGSDDAEQRSNGSVTLTSSDLELVEESGKRQIVGLRFANLGIAPGSTVHHASVQFSVDEPSSDATSLRIRAEAVDNAAGFTTAAGSLAARPTNVATVQWNPAPWPTVGARGVDQQSPNLASLVQSAVSRPGWSPDNALVLLIEGAGSRVAEARDSGATTSPVLHIEFAPGPPANAPSLAGVAPSAGTPGQAVVLTGSNLLGATAVTFGGIDAAFAAVSDTEVTATVPAELAVGPATVAITTAAGTGASAVDFVVEAPTPIEVPTDYATIQGAIDAAVEGDTILVHPGTYVESLVIDKTLHLMSTFVTTGDPAMVDATVIASDGVLDGVLIESTVGPSTTLQGFLITSGAVDPDPGLDGVRVMATAHILDNHIVKFGDAIDFDPPLPTPATCYCERNLIEDNGDDAIDLDGAAAAHIVGNTLRNNGDDGIEMRIHDYASPLLITIRDNVITGNRQDGIQIIDEPGASNRHFVIDRNIIADNSRAGLGLMDNATTTEDYRAASLLDAIDFTNNTVMANNHGVSGGDNVVAVNNLFVGNDVAIKGVDGPSIVSHTLFWDNGVDTVSSNVDSATRIDADPQLQPDNTLSSSSPAIDAGIAMFAGLGRTVLDRSPADYSGTAPDLGARELVLFPPAAPVISTPTQSSVVTVADITVEGTADPNTAVGLIDGFTVIAITTSDASGNWSIDMTNVANGPHWLWALSANSAGFSGVNGVTAFSVDVS